MLKSAFLNVPFCIYLADKIIKTFKHTSNFLLLLSQNFMKETVKLQASKHESF